ncbi:MAG: methyltransferase domain-containing protein [Desulfomonile tiedjei]|nr:methyltransferase domain-containing protein [Desulfomonile tiedjei]
MPSERINFGCGTTPTEGWRNFDNSLSLRLSRIPLLPAILYKCKLIQRAQYQFIQYARYNRIEYGDATQGLPLADGSIDVLYSSHMLEHLDRMEASIFLKEAKRVLRSGGIIRLALPDLRKQVRQYLESSDADSFIEGTHLCQPRPRTIAQRLRILLVGTRHHQWMYDGDSACKTLLTHGFLNPAILPPGETGIHDPGLLDLNERADESVYVEARNP